MSAIEAGKQAFFNGLTLADNPHTCGVTKLGNVKLTEEGVDWERGYLSVKPARIASAKEMADSRKLDVSRFRRKSNRSY
jgi:hypothetical protein